MRRTLRILPGMLLLLCWGWAAPVLTLAAEKSAVALEQEYQSQKNPRKRSDIAKQLMNERLAQLRTYIGTGTMLSDSSPELANYRTALGLLADAVREAAHNGTSKSAETHLRAQVNGLENLKLNVSAAERPLLEQLLAAVVKAREEILYSVWHPPEKKS